MDSEIRIFQWPRFESWLDLSFCPAAIPSTGGVIILPVKHIQTHMIFCTGSSLLLWSRRASDATLPLPLLQSASITDIPHAAPHARSTFSAKAVPRRFPRFLDAKSLGYNNTRVEQLHFTSSHPAEWGPLPSNVVRPTFPVKKTSFHQTFHPHIPLLSPQPARS